MKNLSKKIGAGVLASSLILGGAVSTGLVANADSVGQAKVEQSDKHEYNELFNKLENDYGLGDLEILKGAKELFKFEVFGYYLEDKARMQEDIKDFLNDAQVKLDKIKYEKVKELLEKEISDNKDPNYYPSAKYFLSDLWQNGMKKGIKKVQIGDAIGIFVFKDNVKPQQEELSEESIKKWGEKWQKEFMDENTKWRWSKLQVSDIEGQDHKVVFNDMIQLINEGILEAK